MRARLVILLASCLSIHVPVAGLAQFPEPIGGWIGIYDDPEMTRTTGVMTGSDKELFLGFKFHPESVYSSFGSLSFSIVGLSDIDHSFEILDDPSVVLGEVAAPEDTANGGGIVIAWSACLPGDSIFGILTLHVEGPPPKDLKLSISRWYSPNTPTSDFPRFGGCGRCDFCESRIGSTEYTLNPSVAVLSRNWSAIKLLYVDEGR